MLNNLERKEQKYSAYINTTIEPIAHERWARVAKTHVEKRPVKKYVKSKIEENWKF